MRENFADRHPDSPTSYGTYHCSASKSPLQTLVIINVKREIQLCSKGTDMRRKKSSARLRSHKFFYFFLNINYFSGNKGRNKFSKENILFVAYLYFHQKALLE